MFSVYKGVAHPWLSDVMGHMTTRHYMAMFDDASYHFLHEAFGWVPGAEDGPGWADVNHVINYADEVPAGSLLEIFAEIRRVGGKSITIHYEMRNLTRDGVAATLESTSVLFDMKARKAIALTDEMRARAEGYMAPPAS